MSLNYLILNIFLNRSEPTLIILLKNKKYLQARGGREYTEYLVLDSVIFHMCTFLCINLQKVSTLFAKFFLLLFHLW